MKKMILGALAALALTACSGQMDPPTINQITTEGEWFQMKTHDGKMVWCWQYGTRGEGMYGESPSWFDVECDFSTTNP